MTATYDITTGELIVHGEEIISFMAIVPKEQEEDYWNTVRGRDGDMLYDINLFDYDNGLQLQYVNLVTDDHGELTCGDDYRLAELVVTESIPPIKIMKKELYVNRLAFLEWYASDKDDYQNIGKCVVDSLKKDKSVTFTVQDFFQGMVDLGCIPNQLIINMEDVEDFDGETIDFAEYKFKLID
jgi:hypothetical protein